MNSPARKEALDMLSIFSSTNIKDCLSTETMPLNFIVDGRKLLGIDGRILAGIRLVNGLSDCHL